MKCQRRASLNYEIIQINDSIRLVFLITMVCISIGLSVEVLKILPSQILNQLSELGSYWLSDALWEVKLTQNLNKALDINMKSSSCELILDFNLRVGLLNDLNRLTQPLEEDLNCGLNCQNPKQYFMHSFNFLHQSAHVVLSFQVFSRLIPVYFSCVF